MLTCFMAALVFRWFLLRLPLRQLALAFSDDFAAPHRGTMLHPAFAAGMRVPELVGLQLSQIDRQGASTVRRASSPCALL
jgi:hypothetical protein